MSADMLTGEELAWLHENGCGMAVEAKLLRAYESLTADNDRLDEQWHETQTQVDALTAELAAERAQATRAGARCAAAERLLGQCMCQRNDARLGNIALRKAIDAAVAELEPLEEYLQGHPRTASRALSALKAAWSKP